MDTTSYDGTYVYRWTPPPTRGAHTAWFNVHLGVIVDSPNLRTTPLVSFIGKPLIEFVQARMMPGWPHKDDRCLQWS